VAAINTSRRDPKASRESFLGGSHFRTKIEAWSTVGAKVKVSAVAIAVSARAFEAFQPRDAEQSIERPHVGAGVLRPTHFRSCHFPLCREAVTKTAPRTNESLKGYAA